MTPASHKTRFADLDMWMQKAAALLESNRIHVDGHAYTAPSLDTGDFGRKDYANQFMWDSCFHALVWRWFDPDKAQQELLALVSRQVKDGVDAGMIPHCNYWRRGGEWLWSQPERSSITQPPLIAVAAQRIYERSGDRAFLTEIYARNAEYHAWFDRRRDPDGDGLICLIHPWECGGDALPRWDASMGLAEGFTHEAGRAARIDLGRKLHEFDTDPAALAEHGLFHVEPMDYNAIRAADLEAMTAIAQTLGKPDEAAGWQRRAQALRDAFQARMIEGGLPYDLDGPDETPIVRASAGQFVTLFGGLPTPPQADRLARQLQEPRFWTQYPVPTSPTDDSTYDPHTYWRGNVWPPVNWLIYQGLRRYGYDDLADDLALRSYALIQQSGFREYYHPDTGQGLGGQAFSWAGILLDMAASTCDR